MVRRGAPPTTAWQCVTPGLWGRSLNGIFNLAAMTLIVLCQTVDHLLDVQLSLSKIRNLLSENGLFFVDIVDFRAAYRRNKSIVGAVKIDHPYYLVEATMTAYLRRNGFQIWAVNYAADHLHIGTRCVRGEKEPDALPDPEHVAAQWREIRSIQNPID
jgi:hypothetical protein